MDSRADPLPGELPADAVAIVGLALRLPGNLCSEAALREALNAGRDLVGEIPADRWAVDELRHPRRGEPGRSITFAAGVVDLPTAFDAAFFGISPREAAVLDPQQRMMLELAWEAIEDAGLAASALRGSDCSVHVGLSSLDNGMRGLDDLANMTAHAMTGNTLSLVANRVSWFLDLHGPSLAIDTACSSSLVALHQACALLRAGEASRALVGGVNLLLHPYSFVGFTQAAMLSPRGRCRAFDAGGDGYVRAEGGVMLLLKRARDALADGDRIHALVVGSGVNTDGARKTGLTIPSVEAQAELMARVLARAGLRADDLDFVEAHGTGTPVGDPIEATALGRVHAGRPAPLPIGSVKTNLGHLEPVSGLAGLLKALVALKQGEVPPSLHFESPNPHIDFDALRLRVAREAVALPPGRPWRAGINSFGFGGANAHAILQSAPRLAAVAPIPDVPALVLSAADEGALRALAGAWSERLASATPEQARALAAAAWWRRERLALRLATPLADAAPALAAFARGEQGPACAQERAPSAGPVRLAFVYSGNGSQWRGMGRRLFQACDAFRRHFMAIDAALRCHGFDAIEALGSDALPVADTEYAQPLLFALQAALTAVLRERGCAPHAVMGHSVGEIAAAWASGALDLPSAAALVVARSRAQAATRGSGRMAAVGWPESRAREWIARAGDDDIALAAVNSPRQVTLSGTPAALALARQAIEREGGFFRELALDHAFHCAAMDPIEGPLRAALAGLRPMRASAAVFVSSVDGAVRDGIALDADYWWRNVREPVRFADAAQALAALGCTVFVEVGPHAVLQRYLGETLGGGVRVLSTLRRDDDGPSRWEDTVLRLHALQPAGPMPAGVPHPPLPSYPWQREPHWPAPTPESHRLAERRRVHPLLGWRLTEAPASWENTLDALVLPWLADHRVAGSVLMPATGFVELALAAAREVSGRDRVACENLEIHAPMPFEDGASRVLRFELAMADGRFTVSSRRRGGADAWTMHASGRVIEAVGARPGEPAADEAGGEWLDAATIGALAASVGIDLGPAFRAMRGSRRHGDVIDTQLFDAGFERRAATLDGGLQSVLAAFREEIERGDARTMLPVRIGRAECFGRAPIVASRLRLRRRSERGALLDLDFFDANGGLVVRLADCRLRVATLQVATVAPGARWHVVGRLQPLPWHERASSVSGFDFADALRRALPDTPERRHWFGETLPLLEALVPALVRDTPPHPALAVADWAASLPPAAAEVEADALLQALWRSAPDAAPTLARLAGVVARWSDASAVEAAIVDPQDPAHATCALAIGITLDRARAAMEPGRRLRWLAIGAGALPGWIPGADDIFVAVDAGDAPHEAAVVATRDAATGALAGDSGLPPCFDVIVFFHALHREALPAITLAQARSWLAPGGVLVIAERHPDWSADLAAALDRAHWHDGARSRLRSPPAWRSALEATGFQRVECVLEPAADGFAAGAYVVVARRGAETAVASDGPASSRWRLLQDTASSSFARAMATSLAAQGQCVDPDDGGAVDHVVDLRGWSDDDATAMLETVQALARDPAPSRYWRIARGGAPCVVPGQAPIAPGQAASWALLRVAANESPALAPVCIDVAGEVAPERVVDELLHPDGADEVVLTAQARHVPRVAPVPAPVEPASRFVLDFDAPGRLRNATWRRLAPKAPGPGEVEVAVRCAGVNFRDVMYTLGLLPEDAVDGGFAGASLGLEFAGRVTRRGEGVGHVGVGDAVFGFAGACFASHVVTRAEAVAPLPPGWRFRDAATAPVAFLTAWHALHGLARVQAGERVLIHGAAGGVGLAALQIARRAGARVLATAGSPGRRALLRRLGACAVFDSRSLAFVEDVLAATDGEGVDIVLNSLAGEAQRRSFGLLRPFGRFLELGKRDFFADAPLGQRPFKDNLAFFGIDADRLWRDRPAWAAEALAGLHRAFAAGELHPLPVRVFPARDAVSALQSMQASRHLGKRAVSMHEPREVPVAAPPEWRPQPGECWLVSGGLAGFGLATARWLASRGVRHLVLAGRRGLASPGAAEAVRDLEAQGVHVVAAACDVADADAVDGLLARIAGVLPPLTGVLHAAMTIEDALIADIDAAQLQSVLRPKWQGARVLDEATRSLPLTRFVLYSSVTTLFGSPGQGSYVAANASLEALARRRRSEGLPASCIAWGPIADSGYLARHEALRDGAARRLGAAPLATARALDRLGEALARDEEVVTIADFDWPVVARLLPAAGSTRFSGLPRNRDAVESDPARALLALEPGEARLRAVDLVRAEVARILCLEPARVDTARSLRESGMDSLMAVELAHALEQRFGVPFPVMALQDTPTVERIADGLLASLRAPARATTDDFAVRVAEYARQHGAILSAPDVAAIAVGGTLPEAAVP